MSGQLDFNDDAARAIERVYLTPDVVAQRCQVLEALSLVPGERVLDVGVGPGLLAYDMAATVGKDGFTAGIDLSAPMLAMTSNRCAEMPWAEFREADATELPYPDASFDAVVSTQVYEYVAEMGKALSEVARVLKPGGRVAILDTDWESFVVNTKDRERNRRVMDAWDEHLFDPFLPSKLGPMLRAARLAVRRIQVIPLVNVAYQPHTYSYGITRMISNFVAGRGGVSKDEADAWRQEFRDLSARGEYFFSLNRFLFLATKS